MALISVRKNYVCPKDYTGEHIPCRTFGGNKEWYALAWLNIRSVFLTTRMKGAVLLNPSKDLIKGNPKGVIIMKESALDSWKCADNYTVLPLRQLPINSLEWLQQSKE